MTEPAIAQDDLQSFPDLSEYGASIRRIRSRLALSDCGERDGGEEERCRVEEHRDGRLKDVDHRARDRGASGLRERVARLQFAVRIDELDSIHERGKVRLVGDVEEHREDADEERQHVEVHDVEQAGDPEDRDGQDDRPAAQVREDEDRSALPPVDPHADEEPEEEEGDRPECPEEPHLLRAGVE